MENKKFDLSEKRTELFNSIPWFDAEGWDRTKIADAIRGQDEEFIRRLKEEIIEDEFSLSVCEQNGECLEHKKCIKLKLENLAGEKFK
jgi:hypothetical protein